MSANSELKIDTDSRVALDLFRMHLSSKDQAEKKELLGDTDKLLKTFANFVFAVSNYGALQDVSK